MADPAVVDPDAPAAGDPPDDPTTDPPELGDAGKKAIQAERARAAEAEKASKAAQRQLKAVQDELAQLRAAGLSDTDKAIEKAKTEARAEAEKELLAKANTRLVRAEIRAAATGTLDPELAVKLLDPAEFDVDDDGEVDRKAISRAIKGLIETHPNLASARTPGSADGGARGTAPSGADMNQMLRRAAGRA